MKQAISIRDGMNLTQEEIEILSFSGNYWMGLFKRASELKVEELKLTKGYETALFYDDFDKRCVDGFMKKNNPFYSPAILVTPLITFFRTGQITDLSLENLRIAFSEGSFQQAIKEMPKNLALEKFGGAEVVIKVIKEWNIRKVKQILSEQDAIDDDALVKKPSAKESLEKSGIIRLIGDESIEYFKKTYTLNQYCITEGEAWIAIYYIDEANTLYGRVYSKMSDGSIEYSDVSGPIGPIALEKYGGEEWVRALPTPVLSYYSGKLLINDFDRRLSEMR